MLAWATPATTARSCCSGMVPPTISANFSWSTQTWCDSGGNPTGTADTGLNTTEQANFGAVNVSLLSQYPSMTDGTLATVDQRTPAAGANQVNYLRGQRGMENFTAGVANEPRQEARPCAMTSSTASPTTYGGRLLPAGCRLRRICGGQCWSHADALRSSQRRACAFYAEPVTSTRWAARRPGRSFPPRSWSTFTPWPTPHRTCIATSSMARRASATSTTARTGRRCSVGGLNDGGRSFYALDVTDLANPKGMWEFNWSSVLRARSIPPTLSATPPTATWASFGHPVISKLSNGTWVVSGHLGATTTSTPRRRPATVSATCMCSTL